MITFDPKRTYVGQKIQDLQNVLNSTNTPKSFPNNHFDTLNSSYDSKQHAMNNPEQYLKTFAARTLGIVPFSVSYLGIEIVKGCATLHESIQKSLSSNKDALGFLIQASRQTLGIPAAIGGIFAFGGAVVFSNSQQLVWGKDTVRYPQEKTDKTLLGRYGSRSLPWKDFKNLIKDFFSSDPSGDSLKKWSKFQVN